MDNFNNWRSIFLAALNSNDLPVEEYLNRCTDCINQIVQYNHLLEPNANLTESFLKDTLIIAIRRILKYKLTFSTKNKANPLVTFIKSCLPLIPWAYMNDRIDIFKTFDEILDPNQNVYTTVVSSSSYQTPNKHSKKNRYNNTPSKAPNPIFSIYDYFISHELFTVMTFRFKMNNEIPILLDHLYFFLSYFNKMSERINEETTIALLYAFFSFFENFIQINILPTKAKLIDQKQILSIFSIIIELANKYSYAEVPNSTLQLIFNYGNNQIRESNLEGQLFGLSIFKIFTDSSGRSLNIFTENIKKMNFVSNLMSRDLHQNVIENSIPILTKMSSLKCIKLSDLKQIYIITKNVHNKQKENMINLIVDLLLEMTLPEVSNFFNENIDESFDYLQLISNYLKKKEVTNEFAEELISKAITVCSNIYSKNENDGNYAINNILTPFFTLKYKKNVLNYCFPHIKKEYNKYIIIIMQKIAQNNTVTIRSDFNIEIYEILCSYLITLEISQRSIIYPLIYAISNSFQKKTSLSLLQSIMNVEDNSLWTFLYTLLIKLGIQAFEQEGTEFIADFIRKMEKIPENREFAEFFKVFMLLYNISLNKIVIERTNSRQKKVIPTKYTVRKLPLDFEEILFNQILTFKNIEIQNISCQTFLDIYSSLEIKSLSCDIFNQLLDKSMNDEQIIRIVDLIYEFCLKNDKENITRIISHSFNEKLHKDELRNPMNLKIKFDLNNKDPPSGEIVQISVNKETPVQIILALVSPELPDAPSKYIIKVRNTERSNCLISYNNFSTSNYVDIQNRIQSNSQILAQGSPSEILRNLRFTERLIHYYKDIKEKQKNVHNEELLNHIWRLLCYLPTDESLQELSAKPEEFLTELQKATDKHYIRYLYQVLLWRLRSKRYQNFYSSELQKILSEVVNQDDLTAFCADEIVCLLEIYPLPEFIVPAIKILANKEINEPTKRIASSVISKFEFDFTDIVVNDDKNVDLIMKAISMISPKVWDEFKRFLFNIKNEKSLYTMSIKALTKNLPNSQYFTEIFSLYLPNFLVEDSSRQISLCLKLMKENPSIGLATTLNKIIANKVKNKDKNVESMSQIVDEITSIAELCNDSEILKSLFDSISKINLYDESSRQTIDNFINKVNNIKLERWSFVPEIHIQEYRGLRNLQATCYMNSALQQLFHIPAFCYLISKVDTEKMDDNNRDFVKSLQYLMDDVQLMKTRYCDPEVFFYSFSKLHNGLFVTNEQQDAQEFLTFFLDDLPKETKSLFEGVIETTTKEKTDTNSNNNNDDEDENDDDSSGFIQSREEPFLTLPLPIKDFDNMNDSLHSLSQHQVLFGDNQYTLPDGRKIDAEQSQRIKVAPSILVIQLKRFEYNLTTYERIKINKKFEILKNISLKENMANESKNLGDYNYTLHGVVVHRGEGSHGHYTSLITIDGDWYKFDDIDVRKVDEKVFRQEAFGEDEDELKKNNNNNNNKNDDFDYYMMNNINGYLLFYIKNDAKVEGKLLLDNSFNILIPENKRESIEKENRSYLFEQFSFLEPTFNFFNEISTPDQLRDYFFNVFSHSKQNAQELSLLIVERLKELYQSQPQLISDLVEWMSNNFKEKVLDIYVRCSVNEIIQALTDLILFSCSNVPVDSSGSFIGNFIMELQQLIPKWRQLSEICQMIVKYLKLSPENVKFAQEMGWCDLVMIFIYEVFNGSRTDNTLKIINVSEIFEIAKIIASFEYAHVYIDLPNIKDMVIKSNLSYNAYKSLLVRCTALNIFEISEMSKLIPEEFTKPKMMEMYLSKVDTTNFNEIVVDKLEKKMQYKRNLIMEYFISKKNEFKIILIANPDYLIDSLLLSGNEYGDLANKTEKLMLELYNNNNNDKEIGIEVKKEILNKMINIVPSLKTRKDIQLSPFLHIFLVMLDTTNYPRNKPIKGLEDLKTESEYMLAISAYSDSSQLVNIFESKAKKIINNGIPVSVSLVSTNKFVAEFTPVLESASTDLFIQLINRNEWNMIIERYRSAYSGYDLLTVTHLLDVVVQKNSNFASQVPFPTETVNSTINFIVKIMTMNGSCDPQYSSNFAKSLPLFIDYVKDPKVIETLVRVVANVFNLSNLSTKVREELIKYYFISIPIFMYKHTNTEKKAKTASQDNDNNNNDNGEAVDDDEAKMFRDAFASFSIQRIDNVCSFISNVKREDALISMQFLVCISTFNETYRQDLIHFAETKTKTVSMSIKGTKAIDNFIMAGLLFQLYFIKTGKETMNNMVEVYNNASRGYQGKREAMFQILNKLQVEKSKGWDGVFASLIFDKAKFEKDEERNFFKNALPKLKTADIRPLLKRCSEAFNLTGAVQSSSKDDAAVQLEKIALLVESFSNKMKKEEILAFFKIDKNWSGQASRFEKAIQAIYGKE